MPPKDNVKKCRTWKVTHEVIPGVATEAQLVMDIGELSHTYKIDGLEVTNWYHFYLKEIEHVHVLLKLKNEVPQFQGKFMTARYSRSSLLGHSLTGCSANSN